MKYGALQRLQSYWTEVYAHNDRRRRTNSVLCRVNRQQDDEREDVGLRSINCGSAVKNHLLNWGLRRVVLVFALTAAFPQQAWAWSLFESKNDHVEDGNALYQEGKVGEALEKFEQAARQLPSSPEVHLNRGLALAQTGKMNRAKEAFLMAAEPPASEATRSAAYYNLGRLFFEQGQQAAKEEQWDQAQSSFRESVDAFKRSLKAKPGNPDAGWNLELASRKIEEVQKEKENQENEDKEEEEEQNKNEQDQDEEQEEKENQDEQDQDEQNQEDSEDSESDSQEKDDSGEGTEEENQESSEKEKDTQQPENENEQSNEPSPAEQQPQDMKEEGTPQHILQTLDALQEQEESFEQKRAKQRAIMQRRRVLKDW